ncbi:hypothetical protein EI94DRAFT_1735488 [Lactarius quietus]|nr:hypothetical protein EI94DRAFT_1735488 [Lactarius quietus]
MAPFGRSLTMPRLLLDINPSTRPKPTPIVTPPAMDTLSSPDSEVPVEGPSCQFVPEPLEIFTLQLPRRHSYAKPIRDLRPGLDLRWHHCC